MSPLCQSRLAAGDGVSHDGPGQQPPLLGAEGAGEEMAWLFSSWWFSPGCLPRTQAQRCRAQPCQAMWLVKGGCLPLLGLEHLGARADARQAWGQAVNRGQVGEEMERVPPACGQAIVRSHCISVGSLPFGGLSGPGLAGIAFYFI